MGADDEAKRQAAFRDAQRRSMIEQREAMARRSIGGFPEVLLTDEEREYRRREQYRAAKYAWSRVVYGEPPQPTDVERFEGLSGVACADVFATAQEIAQWLGIDVRSLDDFARELRSGSRQLSLERYDKLDVAREQQMSRLMTTNETTTAKYEARCGSCGEAINVGTTLTRDNRLGLFVHASCAARPLTEQYLKRFKELKALSREQARRAAMAVGATVTRDKKYVDHVEVCFRGASRLVDEARWAAAIDLATGRDRPTGAAAPAPTGALSPAQVAEVVRQATEAARAEARAALAGSVKVEVVVKVNDKAPVTLKGRAHKQFPRLLKMLGAGVNVWLAGPAGSGKTTAAEQAAEALGLKFYFNGAIDTEYKLSGFVDAQGRVVSTAFRRAYTEGGVYLFDEVDASLPSAVLAFNAALANGHCDFPGAEAPTPKHPDFRCVAAGNTWGLGATSDYVGRFKMDAAFLDRFAQLTWDYDEDLERALASDPAWCTRVQDLRKRAKSRGLKVVISPRATINGGKLLAAGMSVEEVLDATIRAKLTAQDWENLVR